MLPAVAVNEYVQVPAVANDVAKPVKQSQKCYNKSCRINQLSVIL